MKLIKVLIAAALIPCASVAARAAIPFVVAQDTPTLCSTGTLVNFSADSYSIQENLGPATITVQRSGPFGCLSRVDYNTTDGTAISPADYTSVSGIVVFYPGETSKTFTVPIADDSIFESTEDLGLHLTNPLGATLITPKDATLYIVDNDTPTIVPCSSGTAVSFSAPTYTVNEGVGLASIQVVRTSSMCTATVDYNSTDGSATSPADYTAVSGTLVFNLGESFKNITVPILDDSLVESTENLGLHLTNPTNMLLGSPQDATLYIVDNDTVTISTCTIRFSPSAYQQVSEDVGQAVIHVARDSGFCGTSSVDFHTSPVSATPGSDYLSVQGTLQFNPGETDKIISVPIIDDNIQEPTEYLGVILTNPVHAVLDRQTALTLLILDNDTGPVPCSSGTFVSFSTPTYSVGEGAGLASISVMRQGPSACFFTVDYNSTDGTAISPADYTAVSGTLQFNPGETLKNFTVPIVDDLLIESTENLGLHLTNPVHAALTYPQDATLYIVDNDTVTISTLTAVIALPVDDSFKKFVNVANPDKGPMVISYKATAEAPAEMTVYNMQGQKIRELIAQDGQAVWDGRNQQGERVTTDIYLVVLKIGDKISKKKVAIIR